MNPSPVPTPKEGQAAFPMSRRLDLPPHGGTAAPTASAAAAAPLRQHAPHALHQGERVWQETNCYVDLWIELLHGFGLDPRAAFGFTVTQDFEGDQFTFFKFPLDDLERLYGTQVQELAIYDSLEARVQAQTLRGHTVLVEVDGYYLPNTRATSYRREHPKTTIGIDFIDPAARRLGYFHNTGYHLLDGEDYDGVFRKLPQFAQQADLLFPYVEFAKQVRPALEGTALVEASAELLCAHLARRPLVNPISQWREAFPAHLDMLLERGEAFFHPYSFNLMRQLGANFEFLSKYLTWLAAQGFDVPESIPAAAQRIASESMVMQFRLVRAIARRRRDSCEDCFDVLESAYEKTLPPLAALVL
ncbi:DUF1839 family protein [Paraburkholderia fungorum]|uniref:DUF1839 family protein n=1 Tax=Paraburkholderia fungorum TaxID=134537 RepID=A0AAP5QGP1_9BURK|nr:DUF1839 family protein [Paraburkholderia fungorum]MBU7439191.1 DUF1839 family protein [Paraburkholderia fungorum]MDT8842195.1 DUF1839 family protein [Paraburkholderia fungorum]PRZ51272.1 uncharacterized protein DUF1839 [Paraburkholderia fungorum]